MRLRHDWDKRTAPVTRRSTWSTAATLLSATLGVLVFGSCGVFFLAYNALPPFAITDDSGNQFELKRAVPGTVRYTDGWTIEVGPPSAARSADGRAVWVIPVAFTSDYANTTIGVGSCSLSVDGARRDPYSEADQVARLGDVAESHRFAAAGETWRARLAVSRPGPQTRHAVLGCSSMGHVEATFDLTPFLASIP